MLVQALIPEAAIETLDIRILGRLAWVDEIQLNAVVIGPGIKRSTAKLRSIVDDQNVRVSPLACNPVQQFHDPLYGQ